MPVKASVGFQRLRSSSTDFDTRLTRNQFE